MEKDVSYIYEIVDLCKLKLSHRRTPIVGLSEKLFFLLLKSYFLDHSGSVEKKNDSARKKTVFLLRRGVRKLQKYPQENTYLGIV